MDLPDVFQAALGLGVEGTDGIDLVVEEFDADGVFLRDREDVQDAAAQGEFSGQAGDAFALVTGGRKLFDEGGRLADIPRFDADHALHELQRGHQAAEQGVRGGHDGAALFFQQGFQADHALAGKQVAAHVRAGEEQVAGRVEKRLRLAEVLGVLPDLTGADLVVGDEKDAALFRERLRQLQPQVDGGGIRASGHGKRGLLREEGPLHGVEFGKLCQRTVKVFRHPA